MVTRTELKEYASKLMFDMKEEEYETLEEEFDVILKQMELIGEIENIETVKPMTFPYDIYQASLRDDKEEDTLTVEEVLKNAGETLNDQVKVPKVVE